ncbi:MAG: enoyl-CoA hydratase/isomerase family protein [Thermoplasmata archaeon]
MPNIASAPSVDGFRRVSFWREGTVGIVAILSPGMIDNDLMDELIKIFSVAAVDDEVTSVILTGSNYVFSKGISLPKNRSYADLRDYFKRVEGLVLFLTSLEKPVFAAINGIAINNGISLALLTDLVFYSDSTKLTLNGEEPPMLLGSVTLPSKLNLGGSEPIPSGIKVGTENMMEDVLRRATEIQAIPYHLKRRATLSNVESILLREEIAFLDFYLWCEGCVNP